ncbi:hypothetical protein GGI19_002711 [Coemansia pectinata]|uniref:Transmembrane protein n=1 Tax=Coemansia pectinata TaxID=1052879 RepID=A0A9W8LA18_9FUNG|nr:hypothetical protein GGI19_002711 [Coemansia pectinata]
MFEFTPEEQSRVEVANFLGIHLDPIGYVDMSTIIVLSAMYFVEFIALCYQFYNRHYPPLRVKNVPLMCSLYVGGVAWFLGDIFTSGLVHLGQSHLLRNCKFTLIWLRACIGAYYVTSLFALRCFSLYYVFCKGRAFKGRAVYLSLGLTVFSIALFGVISMLVPTELTTHYEEIIDMCYTNRSYIIAVLLVIWSIWTTTAIMSWRMRNIPFCFNERIEILATFILLLAVSTLNTVCLIAIDVYPASLAWRTGLMYTNHVGASLGYWIVMGEATYNCLFNRVEYLQYWVNTLKEDEMERQYEYSTDLDSDITLTLVGNSEPTATTRSMFAHASESQSLEMTKINGSSSPQTQNSAYLVKELDHK